MKPIEDLCVDFYNENHAIASKWYEEHPKDDHPPSLLLLKSDNSIDVIVLTMIMNDEQAGTKAAMIQQTMLGMRLGEVYVKAAMLINEAWLRRMKPGEQLEANRPRNKDHPDRIEVLMFNLLTEHKQAIMSCEIDRKKRTLEQVPLQWLNKLPKGETVSGNMVRNSD